MSRNLLADMYALQFLEEDIVPKVQDIKRDFNDLKGELNTMSMKNIIRYSNWGDWDQLDGKTLEDGEKLRVEFPDGTIKDIEVTMVKSTYDVSDMGTPYTCKSELAYIRSSIFGVSVFVPLIGLKAQRI